MNEISKRINLSSLLYKLLGERLENLEKSNEDELNSINYLNIDSKDIINFLEKNLCFQNQNQQNEINDKIPEIEKREKTPEKKREKTPEKKREKTPEKKREKTPEKKREKTLEKKSEKTPENKREKTPEKILEKKERIPEKTPEKRIEKKQTINKTPSPKKQYIINNEFERTFTQSKKQMLKIEKIENEKVFNSTIEIKKNKRNEKMYKSLTPENLHLKKKKNIQKNININQKEKIKIETKENKKDKKENKENNLDKINKKEIKENNFNKINKKDNKENKNINKENKENSILNTSESTNSQDEKLKKISSLHFHQNEISNILGTLNLEKNLANDELLQDIKITYLEKILNKEKISYHKIFSFLKNDDLKQLLNVNSIYRINSKEILKQRIELEIKQIQKELNNLIEIYQNEIDFNEFKKKPFKLNKKSISVIEYLNSPISEESFLYENKGDLISKDIILVYKIYLCAIDDKFYIKNNKEIWEHICQHFNKRNKKIALGNFIKNEIEDKIFSESTITNLYDISYNVLIKINPQYFKSIDETTSMFVFIVRDILEHIGLSKEKTILIDKQFLLLKSRLKCKTQFLNQIIKGNKAPIKNLEELI